MAPPIPKKSTILSLLAPLGLILLAFGLRVAYLPTLPPGLNFDEAGNGVAALEILQGNPKLWWSIGGGKEPLWPYVIAWSTAIWGNQPLALRLPAAWLGVLTVASVYPLMRTLFGRNYYSNFIALFTMAGLTVSQWHLHFSRLGFRAIWLPLLSSLAVYFFGQRWSSRRHQPTTLITRSLLLSAGCLALAIYAYLAARLLPGVLLLFVMAYWLTTKFNPHAARLLPTDFRWLMVYAGLVILFLSPLIIHFSFHPAELMARSATVSIFNPQWHQGDLIGTIGQTIWRTITTFVSLNGDANPLVNLPHQPAVSIFLMPFFLTGMLASLYHIVYSNRPAPYLLIGIWWLVMILPAILAPEGAPHHLRLLGSLIPTYALIAIGFVIISQWLTQPLGVRQRSLAIYGLPIICYLLVLGQSTMNYFVHWPASTDFTLPFDLYAVQLAEAIAEAPPHASYILPMDIRAGDEARHYTLDYLLADQSAAYRYIPVDEQNAEIGLRQASRQHDELRVVRWTADKHQAADEKEIVRYLLATNSQLVDRQTFPIYEVEIYHITDSPKATFTLPMIDQPIGADFDNRLRLVAVFVKPVVSPGDWLPVAITLAPLTPMTVDYKASVRLISATGERLVQKDRTLRHNFHQGSSLWPPETVNEYYLLAVPPTTPPGNYTVSLVIYHPESQAPLIAGGQAELPLGGVVVR